MNTEQYNEWADKVSILTRAERREIRAQWARIDRVQPTDWHKYLLAAADKKRRILKDIFDNDPLKLLDV